MLIYALNDPILKLAVWQHIQANVSAEDALKMSGSDPKARREVIGKVLKDEQLRTKVAQDMLEDEQTREVMIVYAKENANQENLNAAVAYAQEQVKEEDIAKAKAEAELAAQQAQAQAA